MAGNSVAGAVGGVNAGIPSLAAAGAGMATAMQLAAQGPMSDAGLQTGYTYVQGFSDGVSREIQKSATMALGEPDNLSSRAMLNLAGTGLLRAGSGASTTKTYSGGPSVVTLPAPTPAPPQTITLQVQHLDADGMRTVAQQEIQLVLDQVTGTYQTL